MLYMYALVIGIIIEFQLDFCRKNLVKVAIRISCDYKIHDHFILIPKG